ncbi:(deoxy)nucleoside triphosphate pyrophosphohydrolase [Propionibacteriaceae bacterium Y1685]
MTARAVVGAAIVDDLGDPTVVLGARRTRPAELAGLWEFPGGKVEPGESQAEALVREVREELDVIITVAAPVVGPPDGVAINDDLALFVHWAMITSGTPTPGDTHDQFRWFTAADLIATDWAPADRPLLDQVRTHLGIVG